MVICPQCKGELMDKCPRCGKALTGDNLMCGTSGYYHCVNCYFGGKVWMN